MTFLQSGSTIATGFIAQSALGWPWVCYIFGTVGLVVTAIYLFVAVQAPHVHPRISSAERTYLETTLYKTGENVSAWAVSLSWRLMCALAGRTRSLGTNVNFHTLLGCNCCSCRILFVLYAFVHRNAHVSSKRYELWLRVGEWFRSKTQQMVSNTCLFRTAQWPLYQKY